MLFNIDTLNLRGILLDDNNRFLNFNIYNEGGYNQTYYYEFSDSLGWFASTVDTVMINKGEQHTVFLWPETVNDSLSNNITLRIKPLYHDWAQQTLNFNLYYFNGVLKKVDDVLEIDNFELSQNYPNPFNALTTITYHIPNPSNVDIMVYDSRGKIVKNILRDFQISGKYSVNWDGKNNNGIAVSSGIYFYEIQTQYTHQKRKMLLLK